MLLQRLDRLRLGIGFIGHLASASIRRQGPSEYSTSLAACLLAIVCVTWLRVSRQLTSATVPQTPMVSRAPAGNETRTAPLGLRIKPSLKAALEELAYADHRTVASYIELVLEAHVEAKRKEGKRR